MQASWRIGSLFGIPLYIDYSWFLILFLITLSNATEIETRGLLENSSTLSWIAGLVMAILLFMSVLFHELGHSLVAIYQGIKVNSITLFIFGGVASIDRESKTPTGALLVAIAGPLASLTLFALFFALAKVFHLSAVLEFLTGDLARINLVLAIFNLIPGLPLDGGQVLKAIVWKVTNDRLKGIAWAAASGKLIGWVAVSVGLFFVLFTDALAAVWLIFIGWFIFRNALAYEHLVTLHKTLLALVAADAMSQEFRVVNAHLTLRNFADQYIISYLNKPVVYFAASEGRYRGLISLNIIESTDLAQWDSTTLLSIALPLNSIPHVGEKTPLLEVINRLEEIKDKTITVLTPAGAVAGIIDRGDIVQAIATKLNLAIPPAEIKRIKLEGTYPPGLELPTIIRSISDSSQ
jgi:Zn-dependent protease